MARVPCCRVTQPPRGGRYDCRAARVRVFQTLTGFSQGSISPRSDFLAPRCCAQEMFRSTQIVPKTASSKAKAKEKKEKKEKKESKVKVCARCLSWCGLCSCSLCDVAG